jgi:hypothetical protein
MFGGATAAQCDTNGDRMSQDEATGMTAVARAAPWRPYPSYAAAMLWRPPIPGGKKSDPKARGLLQQASHRAAEQEPR